MWCHAPQKLSYGMPSVIYWCIDQPDKCPNEVTFYWSTYQIQLQIKACSPTKAILILFKIPTVQYSACHKSCWNEHSYWRMKATVCEILALLNLSAEGQFLPSQTFCTSFLQWNNYALTIICVFWLPAVWRPKVWCLRNNISIFII